MPKSRAVARRCAWRLAQIAPLLGDPARTWPCTGSRSPRPAQQADLIVFPELSLTGYFLRDMVPDVALTADAPELAQLAEAAGPGFAGARLCRGIAAAHVLQLGPVCRGGPGRARAPQGLSADLWNVRGAALFCRRQAHCGPSIRPGLGRVGMLVCEDFWHLSALAIMQAEEIDVLICIANSPARGVDAEKVRTAETYERMAKTYAQLLGAVVIVVNRVGFEDGLCFWGGSMVVGPDGAHAGRRRRSSIRRWSWPTSTWPSCAGPG